MCLANSTHSCSFVFQDSWLKETWNNETSNVLEAYQPVFLIALSSYREYNIYSDFVKEIHKNLEEKQPSYSFLIPQQEVVFTVLTAIRSINPRRVTTGCLLPIKAATGNEPFSCFSTQAAQS